LKEDLEHREKQLQIHTYRDGVQGSFPILAIDSDKIKPPMLKEEAKQLKSLESMHIGRIES